MGRFTDAVRQTFADIKSLLKDGALADDLTPTPQHTSQEHAAYAAMKDDMAAMMNEIEDRHDIPRVTSDPQWLSEQVADEMQRREQSRGREDEGPVYEPRAGDELSDAFSAAQQMAADTGSLVRMEFSGVPLLVDSITQYETIEREFDQGLAALNAERVRAGEEQGPVYEPLPGDELSDAFSAAQQMAADTGSLVRMEFSGVSLLVDSVTEYETIEREFDQGLEALHDEKARTGEERGSSAGTGCADMDRALGQWEKSKDGVGEGAPHHVPGEESNEIQR